MFRWKSSKKKLAGCLAAAFLLAAPFGMAERVMAAQKTAAVEVAPTDAAYDARYGVNKKIKGVYDERLAAKCINGTFVGKLNEGVLEFKGIPFVAEQPVGKLRWKAPQPFKKRDGVYEAYYFGKHPLQKVIKSRDYVQGEDCLYLNVYKNPDNATEKKPVMVWVYGGAFQTGGTADPYYDMHNFVKDNSGVIVVTMNYRVGPFGFLHLSHLPDGKDYPDAANLGLLDQQMALRWVKENIEAFGGDADNITIFGESAGGTSVLLHTINPDSQPYFRRAIVQSGTLAMTNNQKTAIELTDKLLAETGCHTVRELRKADPRKLVEAYAKNVLCVYPERDGRIVPINPYEPFENGAASHKDLLQGFNLDEVRAFIGIYGGPEGFVDFCSKNWDENVKDIPISQEDQEKVAELFAFYEDNPVAGAADFSNQLLFFCPSIRVARGQANSGGAVWQYVWTEKSPIPGRGACHGVDIPVVLNNSVRFGVSDERTDFDRTVQQMWVNFATDGDPALDANESPTGTAVNWPKYQPGGATMEINADGCEVMDNLADILVDGPMLELTDYFIN